MLQSAQTDFANKYFSGQVLANKLAGLELQKRIELVTDIFGDFVLATSFSLSDQVLIHALVSNGRVPPLHCSQAITADKASLKAITAERYDLKFQSSDEPVVSIEKFKEPTTTQEPAKFIAIDRKNSIINIDLLADWTTEELVSYVLDHEVPVDPCDMPGFISKAA